MGFRDNLLQKIHIDALAATVVRSMGAPDSGQRIDLEAMRRLVGLSTYTYQRERDLDLYIMGQIDGKPLILVLDNELKIYATGADDIALRKSPTVKEMVSIRNAIKILNDKDVVVTRKADSVYRVQQDLISALDLAYSAADIEALAKDGRDALKNNYVDGLTEMIDLFAELLSFGKAPKSFQVAHHRIWGRKMRNDTGEIEMGPLVVLNLMQNSLKLIHRSVGSRDKAAMARYQQIINGEDEADVSGAEVFSALKDFVMQSGA